MEPQEEALTPEQEQAALETRREEALGKEFDKIMDAVQRYPRIGLGTIMYSYIVPEGELFDDFKKMLASRLLPEGIRISKYYERPGDPMMVVKGVGRVQEIRLLVTPEAIEEAINNDQHLV